MPNSPMPMVDVSNWLLLMIVSTTGGGRMPPLLVLEAFPLLLCIFFRITLDTAKVHDQSAVTSHGHCCGKFVCVAFSDFKFHHFWIIILWHVLCRNLRDENMVHTCRPWSITQMVNDWW
jgi:hypothetical protein